MLRSHGYIRPDAYPCNAVLIGLPTAGVARCRAAFLSPFHLVGAPGSAFPLTDTLGELRLSPTPASACSLAWLTLGAVRLPPGGCFDAPDHTLGDLRLAPFANPNWRLGVTERSWGQCQKASRWPLARKVLRASMGLTVSSFHHAPGNFKRAWITARWPPSTMPLPMGKPSAPAVA